MADKPWTYINIQIDSDLHRRLKVHAAQTGRTIRQTVIDAIEAEIVRGAR